MYTIDGGPRGEALVAEPARTHEEVIREIGRWGTCDPGVEALSFLLSPRAQAVVRDLQRTHDIRFESVSALHRIAVDKHLSPLLLGIAEGRPVSAVELDALAAATRDDRVQSAFSPLGGVESPRAVALERIHLLKSLGKPFAEWWRSYFTGDDGASAPMTDLWRLYIPFGQWIVREKRERRPGELFMVGFNGSPGAGKTVLTNGLAVVLNHLLDAEAEGQAVARSGDDWYLGKRDREALRRHGYDPGPPGIPNRALPGTHDLDWLKRNLLEMERSTQHSALRMGNFDKKADDQPTGADRYFEVRGKVGVFLFDLWFAGAETDVDPMKLREGLRRRVAENLRAWGSVFARMDALWAFDWPPFEQMVWEREAQERLNEQRRGARGMSHEHLRAFMTYMTERSWDWRTTSPIPLDRTVTFRAWRDTNHRMIAVQRGGRAS
ncbi:kinase-like protein [Streptomyces platensis]|uniref:kinase-like protein n=1 Tax=Streptomyces platensis TaxID=58346 RepID=UPI001F26C6D4|nr:kinase-like protein [Streptomyces platensis]MCF3142728.1 kinase-like protein [Streptomyces platensis]